jgi:CHAD domain-containing protein
METVQFATRQLASLLEQFESQVAHAVKSPSPEPVHDLRVAVRRFTQALIAFDEYLPDREVKKIKRSLKDLMALAGDVRNSDIAIKTLSKLQPDDGVLLREQVGRRRKECTERLLTTLDRWIARRSAAKWRTVLLPARTPESCSYPLLDDHARHVLPQIAKVFRKTGNRAAGPKASASEVHHCRIQAKKLRYSLELFEHVYGPAAETAIQRLRDLQSLLGDINDCRTVRALLADLDGADGIESRLKKDQKKKLRKFRKLWEEQFPASAMRQWIHELRTPPRKPIARSISIAAPARTAKRA